MILNLFHSIRIILFINLFQTRKTHLLCLKLFFGHARTVSRVPNQKILYKNLKKPRPSSKTDKVLIFICEAEVMNRIKECSYFRFE